MKISYYEAYVDHQWDPMDFGKFQTFEKSFDFIKSRDKEAKIESSVQNFTYVKTQHFRYTIKFVEDYIS